MDKVKFPDWTPPDLISLYQQVKEDDGDEDFLDCIYRLGTDESMQEIWAWLLENQKNDIARDEGELAKDPLVVSICAGVGWGISLAKNAEIENPIPLNESNKKLAAIIKKTQSLIDDIEGNHQADRTSKGLVGRLIERRLKLRLDQLGFNGSLFSVIGWKKKLADSFEDRQRSLADKKLLTLSVEDRAVFLAQNGINLELVDALKFLCLELNNKIKRTGKMSKSARVYMLPYLNRVFEIHFDKVPKEKFCELVSVVEYDKDKGFNPLSWADIQPYLLKK